MVARVTTAAVAIPILAAVIGAGGPLLTAIVALIAAVAAVEAAALIRPHTSTPMAPPVVVSAVTLVVIAHYLARDSLALISLAPVLAGGAVLALLWALAGSRSFAAFRDATLGLAAALYSGALLSYSLLLREVDDGRDWVYMAIGITFAADTFALFVGRVIGRRKLAPDISPGKTWEGAIGGLLAAVGAGVVLKYALGLEVAAWQIVVIAASAGVFAELGDLFESKLKRLAGAKDSGWLVPGHGGVLDRLDSIVAVIPIVYYLVIWWFQ